MDAREKLLNGLKLAEQQFRLACTVHLAVTNKIQTLDVPVEWTFGRHRVSYKDFGLRPDQAGLSASQLEMTAMFVLAAAIRDALVGTFSNIKGHADGNVVAAYQISRMIRNAFAHNMLYPMWSIDADCKDMTFSIDHVISLHTTDINQKPLDWRHYGGPLAIFYFARFVREKLLEDMIDPNRQLPDQPTTKSYQQGRLVLRQIERIPDDAVLVAEASPGERLNLGEGHYLQVPPTDETNSSDVLRSPTEVSYPYED